MIILYKGYNKNIIVEKVLLKEKAYLEKFILSSLDFSRCEWSSHLRFVEIKSHSVGVDEASWAPPPGELSAKPTEGVKSHQIKTPSVTTSSCHLPQEGGHEYSSPKAIH